MFVRSVFAACALMAFASYSAEPAAVTRAAEQMRVFHAEAALRCLADLKGNPAFDYATWAPKIEALVANVCSVRKALNAKNGIDGKPVADCRCGHCGTPSCACRKVTVDEAVALVEDYRRAMLANPILDFDKILCVHRKIGNPRGAFGGRGSGMTGLNAENHMVAPRTGFRNEIVVLSNIRSLKPETKILYAPEDKTSIVRDLDLDFDASRIMFTGYAGTNNLFAIYEIPAEGVMETPDKVAPGKKPALVSPYDVKNDIQWWDASYLPNKNQVIMLGTAAYQFLPCEDGNMPMAVIYRVDRKTGEVRQLTYEQDSDYTPSITHDGRILYTRWEYSDQPHYWSRVLTTMNPDGIGQLSVWGSNSYVPTFFYYARCVPGSAHKITMMGGGHHDRAEVGRLFMLDPTLARNYPTVYDPPDRDWGVPRHTLRIPFKTFPKEKTGMDHEFPGYGKDVAGDMADPYTMNQFARNKPYFTHPWPLSENYHLAIVKSAGNALMGLYLVDKFDNITLIAEADDGLYCDPIPFVARKRPPIIPDRSKPGAKTCSVHIADIYNGPGLKGVPRGTVKKMRLFSYHYNYHKTGGHSSTGWIEYRKDYRDRVESSWDVKRPLGTVDIEEDGSCCFEMPCNTPVSIQPLDEKGCAVQLMRSWIVGMPGERVSCTGCHEDNRSSVHTKQTIADKKYFNGQIQKIKPLDADGVRPWGFANEVYPVVKKYCLSCHGDPAKAPLAKADQGGIKEKKNNYYGDGFELTGKRLVMDTPENAYRMLHPYIRRPGPESDEAMLNPMEFHASLSPLVQILRKGHHGVKMAPEDCLKIYEWIDLNCPFHGKWNPPKFAGERPDPKNPKSRAGFMWADTDDQVKRRLELQIAYAHNYDNPEKEHDDYAAKLATRTVKPVMPVKCARPAPFTKKEAEKIGWPMTPIQSCDAQLGKISELAPITSKVLVLGNGQSMVFRRIPAGTFPMGSDTGYADEAPVRVVTIDKPFWISEYEVQNQQYHCFDPDHDSRYQDEFGKDHVFPGHIGNHRRMPVVRISWNDARAFCAWLSKTCGVKAELPTEAQWEWAARSGTDTPFPWGGLDDDFSRQANLADRDLRFQVVGFDGGGNIRNRKPFRVDQNYPLHDERWQDDWFMLNFTGRANANRWGLYDMHGNAAEWTLSDYVPYPYDAAKANTLSQEKPKAVRGGSYLSRPRDATSSVRQSAQPWQRVADVGFRVVLTCD